MRRHRFGIDQPDFSFRRKETSVPIENRDHEQITKMPSLIQASASRGCGPATATTIAATTQTRTRATARSTRADPSSTAAATDAAFSR